MLNGLSSASSCRSRLFSRVSGIYSPSSYSVKNGLGTIPACLLNSSTLVTLQLAGNSLTGTLAEELSPSLIDITLSDNLLTGSIPDKIQHHSWTKLDLSYNLFAGILKPSFAPVGLNSSIYLRVNHLSGNIPSVFRNAHNVTILDGNLFGCNFKESSLPRHDRGAKNYQCGSNSYNQAAVVFLCCMLVVVLVALFFMLQLQADRSSSARPTMTSSNMRPSIAATARETLFSVVTLSPLTLYRREMAGWVQSCVKALEKSETSFAFFISKTRTTCVRIGIFIACVLLPVFGILTQYYHSYQYEYGWTLSAAFVSGQYCAMILVIFFSVFVSFWVYELMRLSTEVAAKNDTQKHQQKRHDAPNNTTDASASDQRHSLGVFSVTTGEKHESQPTSWLSERFTDHAIWVLIVVCDMIVVAVVNVGFVYLSLNATLTVVTLAEVLLGLFKAFWDRIMFTDIHYAIKLLTRKSNHNTTVYLNKRNVSVAERGVQLQETDRYSSNPNPIHIQTADIENSNGFGTVKTNTTVSDALPSSATHTAHRMKRRSTLNTLGSETMSQAVMAHYQVFIILNNLVLAPSTAIAIFSTDCFYNIIAPPPTVESSYTYRMCDPYKRDVVCRFANFPATHNANYAPPFYYSYQCSSTILRKYSAAFAYMFIITGVVQPLLSLAITSLLKSEWAWRHCPSLLHGVRMVTPRLLHPVTAETEAWAAAVLDASGALSAGSDDNSSTPQQNDDEEAANSSNHQEDKEKGGGATAATVGEDKASGRDGLLLQGVGEEEGRNHLAAGGAALPTNTASSKTAPPASPVGSTIISANRYAVGMVGKISVLLTFGSVFPLLGILIVASIFMDTWYTQFLVGGAVLQARKQGFTHYLKLLHYNCAEFPAFISKNTVWHLCRFTCIFYGFFVVDASGSEVGYERALLPALLMVALPILLFATVRLLRWYHYRTQHMATDFSDRSTEVTDNSGDKSLGSSFRNRSNHSRHSLLRVSFAPDNRASDDTAHSNNESNYPRPSYLAMTSWLGAGHKKNNNRNSPKYLSDADSSRESGSVSLSSLKPSHTTRSTDVSLGDGSIRGTMETEYNDDPLDFDGGEGGHGGEEGNSGQNSSCIHTDTGNTTSDGDEAANNAGVDTDHPAAPHTGGSTTANEKKKTMQNGDGADISTRRGRINTMMIPPSTSGSSKKHGQIEL